jgi:translation initiation factor IF-3
LSRPFTPRQNSNPASLFRVNGKIRAREVRVIGVDGKQLGIVPLSEALNMARVNAVDLVEISPNAVPPVCRLVDFGKFRYELAKKEKESKKHQHASTVKEVQLSPRIDPHDLSIKTMHAVNFLCEDMKVKVALKFRGREMAHTEVGFEVIKKFIEDIAPFGHPDFQPKLVGRAINLMISPLPRNKRAKNPHADEDAEPGGEPGEPTPAKKVEANAPAGQPAAKAKVPVADAPQTGGLSNPFAGLEIK